MVRKVGGHLLSYAIERVQSFIGSAFEVVHGLFPHIVHLGADFVTALSRSTHLYRWGGGR